MVELVEDRSGRLAARKRLVVSGSGAELAMLRRRLRREAEALASLRHPGIIALLDVVEQDEDVVLVMEYASGGSLADRVTRWGPLDLPTWTATATQLRDALACAHRMGVLHRDVKPSNILYDGNGRAKLSDFGIAWYADATAGLTVPGVPLGTYRFMAPEVVLGQPATAASDVFSLGATLLWALTGTTPYGDATPAVVAARAAVGSLEPVPDDIPSDVRREIQEMLTIDPTDRALLATAVARAPGVDPDRTRAKLPTRALVTSSQLSHPARRATSRGRVVVTTAAAVMVLSGAGAAGYRLATESRGAAPTAASQVPATSPPSTVASTTTTTPTRSTAATTVTSAQTATSTTVTSRRSASTPTTAASPSAPGKVLKALCSLPPLDAACRALHLS